MNWKGTLHLWSWHWHHTSPRKSSGINMKSHNISHCPPTECTTPLFNKQVRAQLPMGRSVITFPVKSQSDVKGDVLRYLQQLCLRQPCFSGGKQTFWQISSVTSLSSFFFFFTYLSSCQYVLYCSVIYPQPMAWHSSVGISAIKHHV